MKGSFTFDAAKSPTFSLGELKQFKQRALAEPGATQQFQELMQLIKPHLLNRKADAVLLTGILLSELAIAVMKERERSQLKEAGRDARAPQPGMAALPDLHQA